MKHPSTRKEAFADLLEQFSQLLSNNGCNDFTVVNTPEMFRAIEEAGALNVGMSLEEFRASSEYQDYGPNVSEDGHKIYTQDFVILSLIEKQLGLK